MAVNADLAGAGSSWHDTNLTRLYAKVYSSQKDPRCTQRRLLLSRPCHNRASPVSGRASCVFLTLCTYRLAVCMPFLLYTYWPVIEDLAFIYIFVMFVAVRSTRSGGTALAALAC